MIIAKNKLLNLEEKTVGSSISLLDAVRNVTRFGLPLAEAVYAASTAPALLHGTLEEVKRQVLDAIEQVAEN